MMPLSFFPWNLSAWSRALRQTGYAGFALIALQIAEFGQINSSDTASTAGHESVLGLVIFRGPFTIIALVLLFAKPTFAKIRNKDFCFIYFVFAAYFTVSTIWSTEPLATFGKGLELFIGLGIILHVSLGPNALERLDALRRLLLLFISTLGLFVLLGYFARLHAFVQHRPGILTGTTAEAPFLSGNGVGYLASALLLSAFAEWQLGRLPWRRAIPQLAYAGFIFLFASSRTSFLIIIVGILLVFLRKSKTLFILFTLGLGVSLFLLRSKVLKFLMKHESQGNFDTLSGRTVMWLAAFREWEKHPYFGYGGGAGGKYVLAHIGLRSAEGFSSVHDGPLELLTGLGIVGFIIGIALFVAVVVASLRQWKRRPELGGTYVLMIHMVITSIMSVGVLGWMGYEMMFYIMLMAILDIQRREERWIRGYTPSKALKSSGVEYA